MVGAFLCPQPIDTLYLLTLSLTHSLKGVAMNEPTVVRGRPKSSAMYPPKWLAKYARRHRMPADIEAFKHAIENTPSLAAAARELDISTATMYRWCKIWGVKVDR